VFRARIGPRMQAPGFESRTPSQELYQSLAAALDHVLGAPGPHALPVSLLVDREDRVQLVYRGAVEPGALLEDTDAYGLHPEAAPARSAYPGRWFFAAQRDLEGLARELRRRGAAEDASFYEGLASSRRGGR
jgi:hypothetical protein